MLDSTNKCTLKEYSDGDKRNNNRIEWSKITCDDNKSECKHYKRKCKFFVSSLKIKNILQSLNIY